MPLSYSIKNLFLNYEIKAYLTRNKNLPTNIRIEIQSTITIKRNNS